MSLSDDQQIVATSCDSGTKHETFREGSTMLTTIYKDETWLEESKLSVFLELTGAGYVNDRPGVDIVTVLDVSDSMKGEKSEGVKAVMRALIDKLGSTDRVSLVTFSNHSNRLCPLRQLSNVSRAEIARLVDGLDAGKAHHKDINGALEMAVQVISDRKYAHGRRAAILLMSDGIGIQPPNIASLEMLPVYAFGFGDKQNPTELMHIAGKSAGGTFSPVDVTGNSMFSNALSECLANLLTVVVTELELTIGKQNSKTKIERVTVGNYSQVVPFSASEDQVVASFGDVYANETCKVQLDLLLSGVSSRQHDDVLEIYYSCRKQGEVFHSIPQIVSVTRVAKPVLDDINQQAEGHKFQFFSLFKTPDTKTFHKPQKSVLPSVTTNFKKRVRDLGNVVERGGFFNGVKMPTKECLPKLGQIVSPSATTTICSSLGYLRNPKMPDILTKDLSGVAGYMFGTDSKTPLNDELKACNHLKQAFESVKVVREILNDYVNQQIGFEASLSESTDPIRSKNVKALGDHINQTFESVKAIEDILNQVVSEVPQDGLDMKLADLESTTSSREENITTSEAKATATSIPVDDMVYVNARLKQAFDSVQIIRGILVNYVNQYNGFGVNQADAADPARAEKVTALGDHINQTFESIKAIENILLNAGSNQSIEAKSEDKNVFPAILLGEHDTSIPVVEPSEALPVDDMAYMTNHVKQALGSVQIIRGVLVEYVNQYNGFGVNQADSTDPDRAAKVKALGDHINCAFDSVEAIEKILQNVESPHSFVA